MFNYLYLGNHAVKRLVWANQDLEEAEHGGICYNLNTQEAEEKDHELKALCVTQKALAQKPK